MTFSEKTKLQLTAYFALVKKGLNRLSRLGAYFVGNFILQLTNFWLLGVILAQSVITSDLVGFGRYIIPGLILSYIISSGLFESSFSIMLTRIHGEMKSIITSPASAPTICLAVLTVSIIRAFFTCGILYLAMGIWVNNSLVMPFHFFFLMMNTVLFFSLVGFIDGITGKDFADLSAITNVLIGLTTAFSGGVFDISTVNSQMFHNLIPYNPMYVLVNAAKYYFHGASYYIPSLYFNASFFTLNLLVFFLAIRVFQRHPNIRF